MKFEKCIEKYWKKQRQKKKIVPTNVFQYEESEKIKKLHDFIINGLKVTFLAYYITIFEKLSFSSATFAKAIKRAFCLGIRFSHAFS